MLLTLCVFAESLLFLLAFFTVLINVETLDYNVSVLHLFCNLILSLSNIVYLVNSVYYSCFLNNIFRSSHFQIFSIVV